LNTTSIIELWKSVGWNTLNDYHDHLRNTDTRIIFEELHPDVVDARQFWKAADEHFATDPVCNHSNCVEQQLSVQQANRHNYNIPLNMGMMAQVEWSISQLRATTGVASVAEIGCGYGSFYENYIEPYPFDGMTYQGFDVVARTEHAVETQGEDGCFSQQQVERYREQFNMFFSSNTFQHLSKRQTSKYMSQIYDMLPYGGYFNLMCVDGEEACYHYGQAIELFSIQQLRSLIIDVGFKIIGSTTMQLVGSLTPHSFALQK